MCIRRADRQCFWTLLEFQAKPPAVIARDAGDVPDVDNRAAVDPPECRWVQRFGQLLDRPVDQRFFFGGDHSRAFVVGLEIADLLDGDEPELLPLPPRDPANLLPAAPHLLVQGSEQAFEVRPRRINALPEALDGFGEPPGA